MKIELRDPNKIMKLSKLGSFHQSKLSFLRSFLQEFIDLDYQKDPLDLDENGYGKAIYSFKKKTFCCERPSVSCARSMAFS